MTRVLSAVALAFALGTVGAVSQKDGIAALTLGTGSAAFAAIAGASAADRATARRLARR